MRRAPIVATIAVVVLAAFAAKAMGEGLRDQHQRAIASGDPESLDQIVLGILTLLPRDESMTGNLGGVLIDQSFLGLAHEDAVLELAAMAEPDSGLAEVASKLLLRLWHNLQEQGVRTEAEIARLALLLHEDANRRRKLAAWNHLLTSDPTATPAATSSEPREQSGPSPPSTPGSTGTTLATTVASARSSGDSHRPPTGGAAGGR